MMIAAETPKPTTKTTKKAKRKVGSVISDYFKSHHLNPKVARAKLRKAGLSAPYSLSDVKKVLGK